MMMYCHLFNLTTTTNIICWYLSHLPWMLVTHSHTVVAVRQEKIHRHASGSVETVLNFIRYSNLC